MWNNHWVCATIYFFKLVTVCYTQFAIKGQDLIIIECDRDVKAIGSWIYPLCRTLHTNLHKEYKLDTGCGRAAKALQLSRDSDYKVKYAANALWEISDNNVKYAVNALRKNSDYNVKYATNALWKISDSNVCYQCYTRDFHPFNCK